jgi:hypothetical protein
MKPDLIDKHVKFKPQEYKKINKYLEETGLNFTGFVKLLIKRELKQKRTA